VKRKNVKVEKLVETRINTPEGLIVVRPFSDANGGRGVEIDSDFEEGGSRCYPQLLVDMVLDYYVKADSPLMVKAVLGATGRHVQ
jgi:hypothetical protein